MTTLPLQELESAQDFIITKLDAANSLLAEAKTAEQAKRIMMWRRPLNDLI